MGPCCRADAGLSVAACDKPASARRPGYLTSASRRGRLSRDDSRSRGTGRLPGRNGPHLRGGATRRCGVGGRGAGADNDDDSSCMYVNVLIRSLLPIVWLYCGCVCACVRACVSACVRIVRSCACMYARTYACARLHACVYSSACACMCLNLCISARTCV